MFFFFSCPPVFSEKKKKGVKLVFFYFVLHFFAVSLSLIMCECFVCYVSLPFTFVIVVVLLGIFDRSVSSTVLHVLGEWPKRKQCGRVNSMGSEGSYRANGFVQDLKVFVAWKLQNLHCMLRD